MLTTPKLSPRDTERRAQELLYEWASGYFNGQPHLSKLGDATFPEVDFFFNQTEIAAPEDKPQLHFVFANFVPHETWWTNTDLSPSHFTLKIPASGVTYNLCDNSVEESVHGKLARSLPGGRDIRWLTRDDGIHEEVLLRSGDWLETRFVPTATALRWVRLGGDYVEQAAVAGVWTAIRTIAVQNPLWDGSKKLVTVDTIILLFVRTVTRGGNGEAGDFLCRSVADNFKELLSDEESRAALTQKGFRRIAITGNAPMASSGFQTRMLTLTASLRYFLPRAQ